MSKDKETPKAPKPQKPEIPKPPTDRIEKGQVPLNPSTKKK